MSQSDKTDPKKPNNSKLVVEGSDPIQEGPPSSDTTEELVSAVTQFLGIGRDPSRNETVKRVASDPKNISKKAASDRNIILPTENSESRRQPETSKALDSKDIQSPSSKSVKDVNSGRIWTKSYSDRQTEQKPQGSERPSLDPTESVVSAVTQFFGIGGDENPTHTKKIANVRNDQIVARSQQVFDNPESSKDVRKQAGGSKVLESKSSTVITKQKSGPETSTKGDHITSPSNMVKVDSKGVNESSLNLEANQKLESKQSSGRPSKDPTESVVSAVTQFFGISKIDKPSKIQKNTADEEKQIIATGQAADENEQSQSQCKVQDTKVQSTVVAEHETTLDSSMNEKIASVEPSLIKNQSQLVNESPNDGKFARRLTETGETSSKRVTIAPGSKSTPTESAVSATTDFLETSHSDQSAPMSKTNIAAFATSSSQKRVEGTSGTVEGGNNQSDTKLALSETTTDPSPGVAVAPILTATTSPKPQDKKTPPTFAAQPLNRKEAEPSATDSKIPASKTPQPVADSKEDTSRMIDGQKRDSDIPTRQRVSASTGVPLTQAIVTGKQSRQSSNADAVASGPTSRVTDQQKQPGEQPAEDSKVSPTPVSTGSRVSSTPATVVTGKQSRQSLNGDAASSGLTSRVTDQQTQPATANAEDSKVSPTPVSTGSRVPSTPATVVTGKHSRQSSKADAVSSGPTSRVTDQQKQPATANVEDSKVSPTPVSTGSRVPSTPATVVTGKHSRQSSKADAVSSGPTSRVTDQRKQPATADAEDSEVSPTPVSAGSRVPSTPPAVVAGKQSRQSSKVDAASAAPTPKVRDQSKQPATAKAEESKVLLTSSVAGAKPINQDSNDHPISAASTKGPHTVAPSNVVTANDPESEVPPRSVPSSSGVPPIPVTEAGNKLSSQKPTVNTISAASTREPQTVSPTNVEIPRLIDEQKQPYTPKTTESKVPSSPVPPTPVGKQDSKKSGTNDKPATLGGVRTDQSKEIIAPKVPNTPVAAQVSEEPRTIPNSPRAFDVHNQAVTGETIRADESQTQLINGTAAPVVTSQNRTVEASRKMDSSSHSQPIPRAASGKPRSSATPQTAVTSKTESLRTLDDKTVESTKTDTNAAPSSPMSATNVPPPAINVQDARTNRDKRPVEQEDQRGTVKANITDSKGPPVSAPVSKQPQSATANVAETTRTTEGPLAATTTGSSAVSSGPGVSLPPSPIILNVPDHKKNDGNNRSSTNEPPPPVQLTEPRMGVATAGSKATSGTPSPVPIRGSHTSTATARQCWICFASDEDEIGMIWVQPCKCKGTTKWVHQSCLQMWVDEKLREHKDKKVACPQCRTEYLIYLPKANILVRSLDQVDNVIYRVCPFIAAGVVIGSFYWNAVTYGAIVMLQVAGSEGASMITQDFQPTVIIVGLPIIPMSLLVFRLFQWEDSFLHILRTTSHCVPLLQYILPGHIVNETGVVTDVPTSTIISFQRVLAGALLTPVIAKICGNLFFPKVESSVWRTLLGGALFISVKGLIKMYHKQQNYKRLSRRKILDYTDENKKMIEQAGPNGRMMNQVVPNPLRFQFVASVENRRSRRR